MSEAIGGDKPENFLASDRPEVVSESRMVSPEIATQIRLARSGSQQALGQLFGEFRQYLLLIANRNVPKSIAPKVAASDLVQETLVEACKIFDRFQGDSPEQIRAWLAAILRFKIGRAQRQFAGTGKRNVRLEVSLEDVPRHDVPADETGSEWIAEHAVELANLHLAIERLPEDYRIAIELRSLQKLPFAELATRLNRSAEAARKIWLRAVMSLKIELKNLSSVSARPDHNGWQSSNS